MALAVDAPGAAGHLCPHLAVVWGASVGASDHEGGAEIGPSGPLVAVAAGRVVQDGAQEHVGGTSRPPVRSIICGGSEDATGSIVSQGSLAVLQADGPRGGLACLPAIGCSSRVGKGIGLLVVHCSCWVAVVLVFC